MFDDLVACQICFEKYSAQSQQQVPKMLSCHHSFCCQCLQSYVDKGIVKTRIVCPVCRAETPILKSNSVAGLPNNFYALKILDAMSKDLGDVNYDKCLSHCNEICDKYCVTCSSALCWKCCIVHCSSHYVESVEKVARRNVASVRTRVVSLEESLGGMERNLALLPVILNSLDGLNASIHDDIRVTFSKIENIIRDRILDLTNTTNNEFTRQREHILLQQANQSRAVSEIREAIETSAMCLNGKSYVDIIRKSEIILNKTFEECPQEKSASASAPSSYMYIPISDMDGSSTVRIEFNPVLVDAAESIIKLVGSVHSNDSPRYNWSPVNSIVYVSQCMWQRRNKALSGVGALHPWLTMLRGLWQDYQISDRLHTIVTTLTTSSKWITRTFWELCGLDRVLDEANSACMPYLLPVLTTIRRDMCLYRHLEYSQIALLFGLGLLRAARISWTSCANSTAEFRHKFVSFCASPQFHGLYLRSIHPLWVTYISPTWHALLDSFPSSTLTTEVDEEVDEEVEQLPVPDQTDSAGNGTFDSSQGYIEEKNEIAAGSYVNSRSIDNIHRYVEELS